MEGGQVEFASLARAGREDVERSSDERAAALARLKKQRDFESHVVAASSSTGPSG
jgi:hypothetical protein